MSDCFDEGRGGLSDRFISDLEAEEFTDIRFVVGSEQQSFAAHRQVLCARSPVFKAMLLGNFTESSTNVIDVPDSNPEIFKTFLKCLYSDQHEKYLPNGFEGLIEVLYLSKKYIVFDLVDSSRSKIIAGFKTITDFTCTEKEFPKVFTDPCKFLHLLENRLKDIADEEDILNYVNFFLTIRISSILKCDGIGNVSQDTLNRCLVVRSKYKKPSELDYLMAVKNWAAKRCIDNSLELNCENLRSVLGSSFCYLCLADLTSADLAGPVRDSGLFTSEEMLALFIALSHQDPEISKQVLEKEGITYNSRESTMSLGFLVFQVPMENVTIRPEELDNNTPILKSFIEIKFSQKNILVGFQCQSYLETLALLIQDAESKSVLIRCKAASASHGMKVFSLCQIVMPSRWYRVFFLAKLQPGMNLLCAKLGAPHAVISVSNVQIEVQNATKYCPYIKSVNIYTGL